MIIFNYYILSINILGFIVCCFDKYKAKNNKYRISERVLFTLSLIGGCYGFFIGMLFCHHKTRKLKFKIIIPAIMLTWLIIIYEINLHYQNKVL